MRAQRVRQLCPLTAEDHADPVQHHRALLLRRFDPDEPHGRTRHRLADRLGIGSVVLAPFDIRLHILRRHQLHVVPQRDQLARPVMRRRTCLYPDQAWRQLCEKLQHPAPRQSLAKHSLTINIHTVHLKHALRDV